MQERISATDAKLRFGYVLKQAEKGDVIVVSRGRPKAVILSYEEYQKIQELRERYRRQEALERLEKLAEQVRRRNESLSSEEAESLSDRFTREVVEQMAAEGKVRNGAGE